MSTLPSDPLVLSGLTVVGSLVVTYATTGWYLRWALRHQVLDRPNERSSHHTPTPRGGGVGIVLAMLINLGLWLWDDHTLRPMIAALVIGMLVLAMVSWLDDLRGLPAIGRLTVQTGTAAGVVLAWGAASGSIVLSTVAGSALTLFLVAWIVTHVNFYNFMDGIDGIAAGQAAIVGLAWMIVGRWQDSHLLTALGGGLAAACLAFLCFNWPPARIFMGDVGSASLGFLTGTLPLFTPVLPLADALIFSTLVSAPFLIDASVTLVQRLLRRENLLQAHRSHQYQRLVASGWSHRTVTALYLGWAIACAAAALWWLAAMPNRELLALGTLIVPEVSLAILTNIRCKRMIRNSD